MPKSPSVRSDRRKPTLRLTSLAAYRMAFGIGKREEEALVIIGETDRAAREPSGFDIVAAGREDPPIFGNLRRIPKAEGFLPVLVEAVVGAGGGKL